MKLLSSHKGLSEKYHNILCCEEIAINLLSLFNMHKRMCESVRCNSVVLFELFKTRRNVEHKQNQWSLINIIVEGYCCFGFCFLICAH